MKRATVLLVIGLTATAVLGEEPVYFPDAGLKAAVEAELGISDPTPTDMLGLTSLVARYSGILDLTGLEYAENIRWLNLLDNQISDISVLSGLTNLQYLFLTENQISDISPLSRLTNLETLGLDGNQISDTRPLSALTNLRYVGLSANQIDDISPLSSLASLEQLWIGNNQISALPVLSGLTNLQWLYLWNNQISDTSPLSALKNLQGLYLWKNEISDTSPLSALTNLQLLDLRDNHIGDISPLSALTNLTFLDLIGNQTSDISPLTALTSLRWLLLNGNPLNWEAYCIYIPIILKNNTGVTLYADPNPYNCDTPEAIVEHAAETIANLDPENLNNANSAMALINKINATLVMIQEGFHVEALEKLHDDILQKTDGCATTGEPDRNDWILTCEDQEELYALITQAIELLVNLIY